MGRVPELARVRLTPLTVADTEEMHEVLSAPALYEYIGGAPPTVAELRERYERWARGSPEPGTEWLNWVIRLPGDGTAIGTVQATLRDDGALGRVAELAWLVGVPWQGRGYAGEAVLAMLALLRPLGVERLVAFVAPANAASAAVARAAGLEPTAHVRDGEVRWSGYLSASQM